MPPIIDYGRLGAAIAFYQEKGYRLVEVPWAVRPEVVALTCPNPKYTGIVDHLGAMVGSAEQSFLQMEIDGLLEPGKYVACTPCIRLGDHEDDLHFPYFMKVELYSNVGILDYLKMLGHAGECFRRFGASKDDLSVEQTEDGYDINVKGIEVGSYGLRKVLAPGSTERTIAWAYGTGLAEPRFGQALAR